MSRKRTIRAARAAFLVLLLTALLAAFSFYPLLVASQETNGFSRALELAGDVGRYSYQSNVVQTVHPTERPENNGRRATTQNFALAGEFDRAAEALRLQFWPYGREINQSLEMKVEEGRTYGRSNEADPWTEVEGGLDFFAPAGDPMGMLDVAENVRPAADSEESLFPAELLPDEYNEAVTRYAFDLNGLRYAHLLRAQMEAELRRRGELPPAMNLGLAGTYAGMEGRGELWVDSRGLPLRQILHVEFPAGSEAMEWVEADIVTDFSGWRPYEVSLLSLDWRDPGSAAVNFLRLKGVNLALLANNSLILGFVLLMAAFAALSLSRLHARKVQALYSIVFIAAMVGAPLLQSRQLAALDSRIADQRQAGEAQHAAAAEAAADRHDPHLNPRQQELPLPRDPKSPGDQPASLNPQPLAASSCTVTATSDCDGDGLLDHIEIYETGTWVDAIDSDNDGISDKMEIQAFNAGSRTWYLDPRNPDSNGDGQLDGLECPSRANIKADGTLDTSVTAAACVDTDGDGVPDVYDFDDDADGVPDAVDDNRIDKIAVSDQTFDLALDGLAAGKSVLVDFTIRPVDSSHLWWTNSEMNWPTNDRNGQIMNVLNQNLPDSENNMMLSTLLEITMPYSSANPSRGLPIKSGVTLSDIGKETPLDDWLDSEALQLYNITISQDTTSGVLTAYVPLSLTRDVVGGTPVAWNGRMYYKLPTGVTDWGTHHSVKLVWAVNMMKDNCEVPQGSTESWSSYCAGTTNWQTTQSIVQLYYDDFIITGLNLEEDHLVHGLAVAQEQNAGGGSAYYNNYLWHLADTLDETFLGAQTVNGIRLTVNEIPAHMPNWGIPTAAVNMTAYYDLPDIASYYKETVGESMISSLATVFPNASQGDTEVMLFVAERRLRTAGLTDGASFASNTITFDLSNRNPVTVGYLRWGTYEYNGATWQSPSVSSSFIAGLGSKLEHVFTEQIIQGLAGGDTDYEFSQAQQGAISLAQSYFLGVEGGSVNLLNDGTEDLSSGVLNDADHLLPAEPAVSIVNIMLGDIKTFYSRLSLSNLSLTSTDAEIERVAHATWASMARSPGQLMESLGYASSGAGATGGSKALLQLAGSTQLMDFQSPSRANSYHLLYRSLVGQARSEYGKTGAQIAGLYEFGNAAFKLKSAISNFNKYFVTGADRSVGQLKSLISESYEAWVWIGFAVEVAAETGLFIYDWASGNIRPDTPAFAQKLALTIANIVVHAIIVVLLLTITSTLLLAVLAVIFLFDAIVGAICDAVGVKPGSAVDQWVCNGIINDLVRIISWIINDTTPLADLTHSGRLKAGLNPPQVVQLTHTPGIVAGNQIALTGVFTSSLYFSYPNWMGYVNASGQLQDPDLEETTMKYAIQKSEQDISLDLDGTSWTSVGGSGTYKGIPTGERFRHTFTTDTTNFDLQAPGINQKIEAYMAEGFAMNEQDCWLIVVVPDCALNTYKDTNHSDLSDSIIFDILPGTLDEFRALQSIDGDRYRLAWDDSFPALDDADGDGLLRSIDPDDSLPDSDGDGLSDFFENQNSFPISDADIDEDGLTDYWEAFYSSDPRRPDTDGDGLLDSEEVFHPNWVYPFENSALSNTNPPANAPGSDTYAGGWTIVYQYNGTAAAHMLVTADPLDPDTDDDTIDDLREKEYGYNPRVASALRILGLDTQVQSTSNDGAFHIRAPYAAIDGQLSYTAVISNELNSRYALGLLQVELPEDTVQATKELGTLQPLETTTLNGTLPVSLAGLSASGTTSMTIRSGAIIDEGTERVLWMHANETAGATSFVDSSYLRNDGECGTACPVSNGNFWALNVQHAAVSVPSPTDFDFSESGGAFSAGFSLMPNGYAIGDLYQFKNLTAAYSSTIGATTGTVNVGIGSDQLEVEIPVSVWSTILITYTPTGTSTSTLKVYVNGLLSASWETKAATISGSAGSVSLGGLHSGAMNLDEFQVFPKALTGTEAAQLFGRPNIEVDFATNTDVIGVSTVSCTGSSCPDASSGGAAFDQAQNLTITELGANGVDFSGGEFSISTWIKPQTREHPFDTAAVDQWNATYVPLGYPPRSTAVDWQGVFGSYGLIPAAGTLGKLSYSPSLYVNETGQMRMTMGTVDDGCVYDTQEGLIAYDTWQHINIVYDGSIITFYVNGEEVNKSTSVCAGVQLPTILYPFQIGRPLSNLYIYLDNLHFPDTSCFSGLSLGINVDGDGQNTNYWQDLVDLNGQDQQIGIDVLLAYDADAAHSIRLYSAPPSYDAPVDVSYVYRTGLTQADLGSHSDPFSVDGCLSQFDNTFNWSLSNDSFQGSLNDFRIYKRTLSDAEAKDVYESSLGPIFNLDEAPGAVVFDEAYDGGAQGICSANSCPDSGIGGILNQAARFDGDDYLRVVGSEILANLEAGFTVAAWIKPDNLSGYQRILAAEQSKSANGFGFGLHNDALVFSLYGDHVFESSAVLTPGVWQHVAASFDYRQGSARLIFWVNGHIADQKLASFTLTPNKDDLYRIGSGTQANSTTGTEFFHGLIDDVAILNQSITGPQSIARLRDRAPVINLHLDEDFGNASFANDGQNHTPATGTAGAGDKGQIREAATFNGSQGLTIPHHTDLDLSTFTVAAWVKPHLEIYSWQTILTKQASWEDRNYSLLLRPNTLLPALWFATGNCSGGSEVLYAQNNLLENQWNHVAATWDGEKAAIYINGALEKSDTIAAVPCQNNGPLSVGVGGDPQSVGHFTGALDEVGVWSEALSAGDIGDMFAYQSRWFDIKETHGIQVDDDDPIVSLDLKDTYIAPGSYVMGISASDPTSEVGLVRYRVGTPDNEGLYHLATYNNGRYMFTLDVPENADKIIVGANVVDLVLNSATTSMTVTVDKTAPEVQGIDGPLLAQNNTQLQMAATITDAGSGVAKNSVKFAIFDRKGHLIAPYLPGVLEEGAGAAQCDGVFCSWQAVLPITQPLYGAYTVEVTAEDNLGNAITSEPNSFVLDTIGPHADVVLQAGTPITPGLTLHGVASDIEHVWSSRTLHLHFEEESGADTFVDPSKNEMAATCDSSGTQCPTAGAAGKYGGAIALDGVDDWLLITHPLLPDADSADHIPVVEQLGLYDSSFTVMAWVNGTDWSGNNMVLSVPPKFTSPTPPALPFPIAYSGLNLGVRDGRPAIDFWETVTISANALPTNEWHHLTWRYDALAQEQAIFVDGLLDTSSGGHRPFNGTQALLLGNLGADYFSGAMDELAVYPMPLTDDQIYNIANSVGASVLDVEVRLRHIDDQGIADTDGVWHQAQLTPAVDFTTWQFTVPDDTVPGSYKIDTRATDSLSASAVINAAAQYGGKESLTAALAAVERDNVRVAGGVYVGYVPGEPVEKPPPVIFLPLVGRP